MSMSLGFGFDFGSAGDSAFDWLNSTAYADLAMFADFNLGRYALPAYGPELLTNGDFAQGSTGWTDVSTGTGSISFSGSQLTINRVDGSNKGVALQTPVTVVGELYEVTATVVSGTAFLGFASSGGNFTAGQIKFYSTAVVVNQNLTIECPSGVSCVVDNVSIKRVILTRDSTTLGANLSASSYTLNTPGGASTNTESPAGTINMNSDGTNVPFADKSFTTVIGRKYRWMFNVATNLVTLRVGTTQGGSTIVPATTSALGFNVLEFEATATTTWVQFRRTNAGIATISSIEIRELPATGAFPKRSATFAEFFAFAASSTTARTYVGADGTYKNDLTANAPRFDWRNGKRQMRLEDARTNLMLRSFTLASSPWFSNGSLDTPGSTYPEYFGAVSQRVASQGAAWNRRAQASSVTVVSGTTYAFKVLYKQGTSPRRTLILERNSDNTSSSVDGVVGSLTTASTRGPITNLTDTLQADGTRLLSGTWVPDFSGGASIGFGPSSTTVGLDVELIGVQFEAGAFASDWIPTGAAAVARAIESARFSPLVEALLQRAASSVVVRAKIDAAAHPDAKLIGFDGLFQRVGFTLAGTKAIHNNGTDLQVTGTNIIPGDPVGIAVGADSSGRSVDDSANALASDAVRGIGTATRVALGRSLNHLTDYAFGNYDFVSFAPERLSNETLQALAVPA